MCVVGAIEQEKMLVLLNEFGRTEFCVPMRLKNMLVCGTCTDEIVQSYPPMNAKNCMHDLERARACVCVCVCACH